MKRRGHFDPFPLVKRAAKLPPPPRLTDPQLHAAGAGFSVWDDDVNRVQDELTAREDHEAIVEEDIGLSYEDSRVLRPIDTNLLGVQIGSLVGVEEDDERDDDLYQVTNPKATVGGEFILDDDLLHPFNNGSSDEELLEGLVLVDEDIVAGLPLPEPAPPEPIPPEPTSPEPTSPEPTSPEPTHTLQTQTPIEFEVAADPLETSVPNPSTPTEGCAPAQTEALNAGDIPDIISGDKSDVGEDILDGPNLKKLDKCGEDFHLAMMLFVTSADLSTTQYEALTEVLALATPASLLSLPKCIKTLRERCRQTFPLLKIKGRLVDVELNSIPPKKVSPRHAYYYDPSEYCRVWLSSTAISSTIHCGLGEFVDTASEIWHGDAWKESVRATSGKFVLIHDSTLPAGSNKVTLLPSDCVSFRDAAGSIALGRVKGVGIDKRSGSTADGLECALINRLVRPEDLPAQWMHAWVNERTRPRGRDVRSTMPIGTSSLPELVMMETREIVECSSIISRVWVYFIDYVNTEELKASLLPVEPAYCVRFIAYGYGNQAAIREVWKRHRLLAELELQELTQSYVLHEFGDHILHDGVSIPADWRADAARPYDANSRHCDKTAPATNTPESLEVTNRPRRISIPYSTFLDGFGLYRNAYYSLKGMYMTPAGMDIHERTRLHNLYVLMIGPFGSSEEQMAACLRLDAIPLGRGCHITLDSGEVVFVTCFPLFLTGDMPQQNQNSGNKTHNAEFGCRSCLIPEKDRGDLDFNSVGQGRYKCHMEYLRESANGLKTQAARDKALQQQGLSSAGPYFAKCYTMMDPHRATPNDPMHAELRLCKYFAEVLLEGILSTTGVKAYRVGWDQVEMPYRWGQPQNPVSHKGSMVFSEHGRVAIINPFVLMLMFTNDRWSYHGKKTGAELNRARNSYIKRGVEARFRQDRIADRGNTGSVANGPLTGAIVRTAFMLARSVTLALQETISPEEREYFSMTLITARKLLQCIFSCATAEDTKKLSFKNYASVPNIHLALHYKDDIENYATARNSSTMMGEQKHKVFKNHATHTNSKDSDLQLMRATNVSQTIRLMLDGAFTESAPHISRQLQEVAARCPILCTRFLGTNAAKRISDLQLSESALPADACFGLDCSESPFSNARTGRGIALKRFLQEDIRHDAELLRRAMLVEYGAQLWPNTRMKVHYWGFFSAERKARASSFRFRVSVDNNMRVQGVDGVSRFCRVVRILTVTIGSMVRVLFVCRKLCRALGEETNMAPYNVYQLSGDLLVLYGMRSIEPVIHHFVTKAEGFWWHNPYVPHFL